MHTSFNVLKMFDNKFLLQNSNCCILFYACCFQRYQWRKCEHKIPLKRNNPGKNCASFNTYHNFHKSSDSDRSFHICPKSMIVNYITKLPPPRPPLSNNFLVYICIRAWCHNFSCTTVEKKRTFFLDSWSHQFQLFSMCENFPFCHYCLCH